MVVSVREVAALAGVSVGTVSNVLNRPEKVADETVERVRGAIAQLGFVRNDAARQLRAGRSRSLGLIVLDVGNPFFTDLARGAEDKAAEAGLSVLLGNSDENADRESAYLDLFEEQRVNGVLLSPIGDATDRIARLRARGIPTVLVDRPSDTTSFSSVSVDDVLGGTIAVEHLTAIGCRSLAFVGGPQRIRQVSDRLDGVRRAVASADGGVRLEIIDTDSLTVLQGRRAGLAIGGRAASERPDGVFAANDLLALGVLQGLSASGIRVPDDIALIGYDDIEFAASASVALSSVKQPARMIGEAALQLLLDEIEAGDAFEHRHVRFEPELVARESTARPS
jgi:LacI family transcriptional regulator